MKGTHPEVCVMAEDAGCGTSIQLFADVLFAPSESFVLSPESVIVRGS